MYMTTKITLSQANCDMVKKPTHCGGTFKKNGIDTPRSEGIVAIENDSIGKWWKPGVQTYLSNGVRSGFTKTTSYLECTTLIDACNNPFKVLEAKNKPTWDFV